MRVLLASVAVLFSAFQASAEEFRQELPVEQRAFLTAVKEHRDLYNSASNEMMAGAQRPNRAKAICKIIKKRRAKDWIGTISVLTSNGDGKGVISINIGEDTTLGTWNNALSDVGDNTLIPSDSPVFAQAASLAEGQPVKFSARFFSSETDCIREKSATLSGSMSAPEYLIRLERIEAAGEVQKSEQKKSGSSVLKSLFE